MNNKQQVKYDQAKSKGEQFFQRKNYQLAKQHFSVMLRLNPSLKKDDPDFAANYDLCEQHENERLHKESLKKARNLEKKNKLNQALAEFEKAHALQQQSWLAEKIEKMRLQLQKDQLIEKVQSKNTVNDPQQELEAYDKLLALDPDNHQLQSQQAICHVKLQNYSRAIELLLQLRKAKTDFTDRHYYYLGYAYLASGDLVKALLQWAEINPSRNWLKTIYQQVAELVNCLPQSLLEQQSQLLASAQQDRPDLEKLFHFVNRVAKQSGLSSITETASQIKSLYLQQLWQDEQYEKIHQLLTPFEQPLTLSKLDFYHKLYQRLAAVKPEREYIEYAITFGLSAIYNEKLLQQLSVFQSDEAVLDTAQVQHLLLQQLEQMVTQYQSKNQTDKGIPAFWKNEQSLVQLLEQVANKSKSFKKNLHMEFFISTSKLAWLFDLQQPVYSILAANSRYLKGKNLQLTENSYLDLLTSFSPLVEYLYLANENQQALALKKLAQEHSFNFDFSPVSEQDIRNYCQQTISVSYAISLLLKGESRAEKYFMQGLNLLKSFPLYQQEMIKISKLENLNPVIYFQLAKIMEILAADIKDKEFKQATADIMAMKALEIIKQEGSVDSIDKILQKAEQIYPGRLLVNDAKSFNETNKNMIKLGKAMHKDNFFQAASIVLESDNYEVTSVFFSRLNSWSDDIASSVDLPSSLKISLLNDMLKAAMRVDQQHPVIATIKFCIRRVEDE